MLISHHKKCLFIHIQKTAGSSITGLLSQHISDMSPYLGTHDHALWAKNQNDIVWDDYYKFAFVRNPWDRLVSWYMMITQQAQNRKETKSLEPINELWRYVLDNSYSFDTFLNNCTGIIDDIDGRKSFIYNQLDYLTSESGEIIVDYIGRFESLESDSQRLFNDLGINNIVIPHLNPSQRSHYRDYYTDATRQLVAKRFERDIDFFEYEF